MSFGLHSSRTDPQPLSFLTLTFLKSTSNLFPWLSLSLDVYDVPHDLIRVMHLEQEYPRTPVMIFDRYWRPHFQN